MDAIDDRLTRSDGYLPPGAFDRWIHITGYSCPENVMDSQAVQRVVGGYVPQTPLCFLNVVNGSQYEY